MNIGNVLDSAFLVGALGLGVLGGWSVCAHLSGGPVPAVPRPSEPPKIGLVSLGNEMEVRVDSGEHGAYVRFRVPDGGIDQITVTNFVRATPRTLSRTEPTSVARYEYHGSNIVEVVDPPTGQFPTPTVTAEANGANILVKVHAGQWTFYTNLVRELVTVTNFVKTGRDDRAGSVTMRHRGDGIFELVFLHGGYTNYFEAPEGFRKVKDIHGDEVIVPACPEVKLLPGSLFHTNGLSGNPFLNAVP